VYVVVWEDVAVSVVTEYVVGGKVELVYVVVGLVVLVRGKLNGKVELVYVVVWEDVVG